MFLGILVCILFMAFNFAMVKLEELANIEKPKDWLLLSTPSHNFKLYIQQDYAYGLTDKGIVEGVKGSVLTVDGPLGYLWMELGIAILYELSEPYKLIEGAKRRIAVGTTHYITVNGTKTRHCVTKIEDNLVYFVPIYDLGENHSYSYYSYGDGLPICGFVQSEVCYDNVKIRDLDKCVQEHLQLQVPERILDKFISG